MRKRRLRGLSDLPTGSWRRGYRTGNQIRCVQEFPLCFREAEMREIFHDVLWPLLKRLRSSELLGEEAVTRQGGRRMARLYGRGLPPVALRGVFRGETPTSSTITHRWNLKKGHDEFLCRTDSYGFQRRQVGGGEGMR